MLLSGRELAEMLIQKAVKLINLIPYGWVRVDEVRKTSAGLDLYLSVHKDKRGRKLDAWIVRSRGVHEANITDFDGGGLAVYGHSHEAARQYTARQAQLRWPRSSNEAEVLAALYRAHVELVDDWIPFDRYLLIHTPWIAPSFAPSSGDRFICEGPDFLIRAYAKALRSVCEQVQVTLRRRSKHTSIRPKSFTSAHPMWSQTL
jgi:hypothetical protein